MCQGSISGSSLTYAVLFPLFTLGACCAVENGAGMQETATQLHIIGAEPPLLGEIYRWPTYRHT